MSVPSLSIFPSTHNICKQEDNLIISTVRFSIPHLTQRYPTQSQFPSRLKFKDPHTSSDTFATFHCLCRCLSNTHLSKKLMKCIRIFKKIFSSKLSFKQTFTGQRIQMKCIWIFQKGSRPPPGCYNGSSLALRSPEIFINQRNETGFGIILSVEFSNVHCLHHLKQKWKNMDLKLMRGKSEGSIQGKVWLEAGFVSYSWSN